MTAPVRRGLLAAGCAAARLTVDAVPNEKGAVPVVTFIWFVIWLIANNVGAAEPLLLDPVNAWVGTLILAAALDLGGAHARRATA